MSQMLKRQLERAISQDADPWQDVDEQPTKPLTDGLVMWWPKPATETPYLDTGDIAPDATLSAGVAGDGGLVKRSALTPVYARLSMGSAPSIPMFCEGDVITLTVDGTEIKSRVVSAKPSYWPTFTTVMVLERVDGAGADDAAKAIADMAALY